MSLEIEKNPKVKAFEESVEEQEKIELNEEKKI